MAVTETTKVAAIQKTAPRSVTVLGATGSIGLNALDIISRSPDRWQVVALTANTNVEELARQALAHRPAFVALGDPSGYEALKSALSGSGIDCAAGPEAVIEAAAMQAEVVMAAIVGTAGLAPTLQAVRRGAIVGLANKECLVSAGDYFMSEVKACNAALLPVDSEHNAIFQVFDFENPNRVEKIILTASGGPFRTASLEDMKAATPAIALKHPNWSMGAKISIDSATMMNKGLELIEAHYLFPIEEPQIEIVVHPQSIVHSLVSYVDGSVLAQLGTPDMRIPIGFALSWPERGETPAKRLDLTSMSDLTFEAPDLDRFPSLRLAREALRAGGAAPTALNAANEVAVQAFLDERIGFLDIVGTVEAVLEQASGATPASLEDVITLDLAARDMANRAIATI